ncbi:MAG: hypothetical protein M1814_001774 [Vezdaea aestivalis]|nr:MAG: hypothetical protein M1814_001774 [Vezdaea aestivalis]
MSSIPILRSQSFCSGSSLDHHLPLNRTLQDSSGNVQNAGNNWQKYDTYLSNGGHHGPLFPLPSQSDRLRQKRQQQEFRRQRKEETEQNKLLFADGRYVGDFLQQEADLERGGSLQQVIDQRSVFEKALEGPIKRAMKNEKKEKRASEKRYLQKKGLPEQSCSGDEDNSDDEDDLQQDGSNYLRYRINNRKKPLEKQTWTDKVEDAFIRAIYIFRPYGNGRCQVRDGSSLEAKAQGRNEVISEYISKQTGVYMSRKKVSSHIQTLKNHMKFNILFLSLVVACDESKEDIKSSKFPIRRALSTRAGSHMSKSYSNLNRSIYSARYGIDQGFGTEPISYAMWIQPDGRGIENKPEESLHTYTPAARNPVKNAHLALDSIGGWKTKFPRLGEIITSGSLNGDLIRLRTSLMFPGSIPLGGPDLKLVPSFELATSSEGMEGCYLKCTTTVYRNGQQSYNGEQDAAMQISGNTAKLSAPFLAQFWSDFFSELVESRKPWADQGLDVEGEVSSRVAKLTAVQEIVAHSESSHVPSRQIAICLWEFSLASRHEKRHTTWHRVNVPRLVPLELADRSQVFEPEVSVPQSMSLASVVSPSFQVQTAFPAPNNGWIGQYHQPWDAGNPESWNQALLVQPLVNHSLSVVRNEPEAFEGDARSEAMSAGQSYEFNSMQDDQFRLTFSDFEGGSGIPSTMNATESIPNSQQHHESQQGVHSIHQFGAHSGFHGAALAYDQQSTTPLEPPPFDNCYFASQNVMVDSGYPSTATNHLSPAATVDEQGEYSGIDRYGDMQWPVPEHEQGYVAEQSYEVV